VIGFNADFVALNEFRETNQFEAQYDECYIIARLPHCTPWLTQTFLCSALYCEWCSVSDDMEHWRAISLPWLDCRNTDQWSTAVSLQVWLISHIMFVVESGT